jgi:glycosyltransferase involved in cell wall biosynthesis/tetratricopeptide (TPR) repeat protein
MTTTNTKIVNIHGKTFIVNDKEFQPIDRKDLEPLKPVNDVAELDRTVGLLNELKNIFQYVISIGYTHGAYIPLCTDLPAVIVCENLENIQDIQSNIKANSLNEKFAVLKCDMADPQNYIALVYSNIDISLINNFGMILSNTEILKLNNYKQYKFSDKYIYVNNNKLNTFQESLKFEIDNNEITYNNLLHLLIMVKNAGEGFRDVLKENLVHVDRWTILDTGSTDNTIQIIKETCANKRGTLYQEPFINFRDSRNRCIELAGKSCKFNVMLDDTYILNGQIRDFLTIARSDDVADSFSLYITEKSAKISSNHWLTYTTNRIAKSEKNLKYVYTIHEILEQNYNCLIPLQYGMIYDNVSEYMQERTLQRKQRDLDYLYEEMKNDPDNPRHLYYTAETYYCMENWENAIKYYDLRSKVPDTGYNEEVYDSLYKLAVLSRDKLGRSWDECEKLYWKAYEAAKMRPEPLYMIGSHYVGIDNLKAYNILKKAVNLPDIKFQMNGRYWISGYYIPYTLLPLCLQFEDYELGELCAQKIMKWNTEKGESTDLANKWWNIFNLLKITPVSGVKELSSKKVFCFVAPGGWTKWDGETFITQGLGGSETFVIKYGEELNRLGNDVIVFCNCEKEKIYNGVKYIPLILYTEYITKNYINYCFVNRYCTYLFPSIKHINKVYFILHDVPILSDIIPHHSNLKKILCISEWQRQAFCNVFPQFTQKTDVISYGLDLKSFPNKSLVKYSFIYPSFANRGLLPLLNMFPKIVAKYPEARLNIFCDLDHWFVKKYYQAEIDQIKPLLEEQKANVINHGWVDSVTLRKYWSQSHVWLYPCVFSETCCLTAYEAAASNTLVVSNHLAALSESIGDRGIVINGNPYTDKWQSDALESLFNVLDSNQEHNYINKNRTWIESKKYSIVVNDFLSKL